jgi:hypothetical protein
MNSMADNQYEPRVTRLVEDAEAYLAATVKCVAVGNSISFEHSSVSADRLIALLKEATDLCPQDSRLRYLYGCALCLGMQGAMGTNELKRALQIDPANMDAKQMLEHPADWRNHFYWPLWHEGQRELPLQIKHYLARELCFIPVRESGRRIVSAFYPVSAGQFRAPPTANPRTKMDFVLSRTPYGPVVAAYLLAEDDPHDPFKQEVLLKATVTKDQLGNAMSGYWLLRSLAGQDYAYLVVIEGDRVVFNKRVHFSEQLKAKLREIEQSLEIDSRPFDESEQRHRRAAQHHMDTFPFDSVRF